MAIFVKKRIWLYLLGVAVLLGSATGVVLWLMAYSPGGGVPEERYYRAVYVLQRMGGPAAEEKVDIPRRVTYADATESLLHHPDKIFVLRRMAEDLAASRGSMPQAALFEGYARLALGEREAAAELLAQYVCDSPYAFRHYDLLCNTLHALGDYSSLLLMCGEWRERDPACNAERMIYVWSALYNLERYAEAKSYMLGEGACLGWQARVYAAKAALAMGQTGEAHQFLEEARKAFPHDTLNIQRLWNGLKEKSII